MFLLFSSAFRPLYKQDILDATCYPNGHVFKFRMPLQTVPVEIKEYRSILIVGGANYELPTDEGD